jgi:hypothetical protein
MEREQKCLRHGSKLNTQQIIVQCIIGANTGSENEPSFYLIHSMSAPPSDSPSARRGFCVSPPIGSIGTLSPPVGSIGT